MRQTVPHDTSVNELTIVHTLAKAHRTPSLPMRLELFHRTVTLCDCRNMDHLLDHLTTLIRSKFHATTLLSSVREVHRAVETHAIDQPRDADMFCLTCLEAACQAALMSLSSETEPSTERGSSTVSILQTPWRWFKQKWREWWLADKMNG